MTIPVKESGRTASTSWKTADTASPVMERHPSDVEASFVLDMNIALSDSKSQQFIKYKNIIESLHKSVTVKSLRCRACSIKLRPGSTAVRDFSRDVESVSFVVEGSWDGWFEKGGTTTILWESNTATGIEKWSPVNTTAQVALTPEKTDEYKDACIKAVITAAITIILEQLVDACK